MCRFRFFMATSIFWGIFNFLRRNLYFQKMNMTTSGCRTTKSIPNDVPFGPQIETWMYSTENRLIFIVAYISEKNLACGGSLIAHFGRSTSCMQFKLHTCDLRNLFNFGQTLIFCHWFISTKSKCPRFWRFFFTIRASCSNWQTTVTLAIHLTKNW